MKKILSLGLALVMLFALVGCSGKEMQSKLAELEAKLQEQSSKIDELEEEKDNLLGQITQLQGEIGGLQGEVERLEEERENDYNQLCALSGGFYSVEEVYKNGWITREDLMRLCYYQNGGVLYARVENGSNLGSDGSIKVMDYEPNFELGELDEETERKIRCAYAYKFRGSMHEDVWTGKASEVTITSYFGTYNNCSAVKISVGWMRPGYEYYEEIDGLVFMFNENPLYVWKENINS